MLTPGTPVFYIANNVRIEESHVIRQDAASVIIACALPGFIRTGQNAKKHFPHSASLIIGFFVFKTNIRQRIFIEKNGQKNSLVK